MMLFEDIALEHHTGLTTRNLLKKAYRQGLGRAYHEKVVRKQIWSNHDISGIQSRHELTGSAISIYLQSLLIFWFDLFFRVGYRNGKLSDGKPSSTLFFAKCFFIELLELDPEVKMITPNDSTSSIKQESLISLVLKKIFGKIQGKLWMVPWFYNWKLKPFFARLFSGFWRVPWFFRWRILIRLDAFAKRLWVFPWFFNHKIMPVVRVVSSKVWLLPWFIKWKVIPALLFWRQLPWWKIPWFFRNKIFAQLWRVPVFIKYRVFAHTWLITWFIKWRLLPISLFLLNFSISMFFPVNTIRLATFYAASLSELERFIKKPWSES